MAVLPHIITGERVGPTVANRVERATALASGLDPDLDFPGYEPRSSFYVGSSYASLAAAIAAAKAAGGGRIIINKVLNITQAGGWGVLVDSSNIWIDFYPGGKIISNVAPGAGSIIQVNTPGATVPLTNVRIRGANIDANNSVDTQIIRMSYVLNSFVEDCELYNVSLASVGSASGVMVDGSLGAALTVSSLTSASGVATATTSVPHGYVTGVYVSVWGANEPEYNGLVKIIVTGASTYTYKVPSLPVTPATGSITSTRVYMCKNVKVIKNYMHDIGTGVAPNGVYCFKTNGVVTAFNDFERGGRGIFYDGPNVGGIIHGNTITDFGDNGIRINPATNVTGSFIENYGHVVSGNTIDGGVRDGIRLNGVKLACVGNTVRNVSEVGIKADVCQDSNIDDNVVENSGIDGISLYKTVTIIQVSGAHKRVSLNNNKCVNNAQYGINVLGGGVLGTQLAEDITALHNHCTYNGAGGIAFADVDSGEIAENQCNENTNGLSSGMKPGIYVRMLQALTSQRGIRIHHNRCRDLRTSGNRQGFGILIDSLTAGATLRQVIIEDNDVSDTPGTYGIRTFATAGTLDPVIVRRNRAINCATPFGLRITDLGDDNQSTTNLKPISGSRGDANVTVVATIDEKVQRLATTLTANRTLTFTNSTYCTVGAFFEVVREDTAAFTWTLQDSTPSTLIVFPSGVKASAKVMWDGAAWRLINYVTH